MKRNLTGPDVSLEISLGEYGFAWERKADEIVFYYGMEYDDDEGFTGFDWASIPTNCDVFVEYDWANFHDVCCTNGITTEEWKLYPLERQIEDLLRYYGSENIFGTSYLGTVFTLGDLLS